MVASLALLATTDILVAFPSLLGEDRGVPPLIIGILLATRAAAGFHRFPPAAAVLLARWSRLPSL